MHYFLLTILNYKEKLKWIKVKSNRIQMYLQNVLYLIIEYIKQSYILKCVVEMCCLANNIYFSMNVGYGSCKAYEEKRQKQRLNIFMHLYLNVENGISCISG